MVDILRNKNHATRFQILIEIASMGPTIHQRSIAAKLEVTPQAVSDYIGQLIADNLLTYSGRAKYKITSEGISWVLKVLKELKAYTTLVNEVINDITISAAIADFNIEKGQRVGLEMRNGMLCAVKADNAESHGTAVNSAKSGEDVGISNIEGLIEFKPGKVQVIVVPGITKGGSKKVSKKLLKEQLKDVDNLAAIGLEAVAALHKIGKTPQYIYDVSGVVTEGTRHGMSFTVVCNDEELNTLTGCLQEADVEYTINNYS